MEISELCDDKRAKVYGKNPTLVIFGESHMESANAEEQAKVIEALKPEYVVHEFLRNYIFCPEMRVLFENPSYLTPTEANDFAEREDCIIEVEEFTRDYNEWIKQEKIDVKIHPFEENFFKMDYTAAGIGLILGINLVKSFIGCDLSHSEVQYLEDKLNLSPEQFASSKHADSRVTKKRENRMGKVIAKYAKKTQPLVAVLGASHIKHHSQIHSHLKRKRIDYITINQYSK